MALQRTLRSLRDAYVKGTDDPEYNEYITEAEWMYRTGLSSTEWENLPMADAEMLITHNVFSRERLIETISIGVAKGLSMAFSKKKGV